MARQQCQMPNCQSTPTDRFTEHVKTHLSINAFQCSGCEQAGNSEDSIDKHIRQYHSRQQQQPQPTVLLISSLDDYMEHYQIIAKQCFPEHNFNFEKVKNHLESRFPLDQDTQKRTRIKKQKNGVSMDCTDTRTPELDGGSRVIEPSSEGLTQNNEEAGTDVEEHVADNKHIMQPSIGTVTDLEEQLKEAQLLIDKQSLELLKNVIKTCEDLVPESHKELLESINIFKTKLLSKEETLKEASIFADFREKHESSTKMKSIFQSSAANYLAHLCKFDKEVKGLIQSLDETSDSEKFG